MQFNISQICSYWLSIYKNQFNIVKEEYKRGYKRGGDLSEGGGFKILGIRGRLRPVPSLWETQVYSYHV